jgi:hypothetical protein
VTKELLPGQIKQTVPEEARAVAPCGETLAGATLPTESEEDPPAESEGEPEEPASEEATAVAEAFVKGRGKKGTRNA